MLELNLFSSLHHHKMLLFMDKLISMLVIQVCVFCKEEVKNTVALKSYCVRQTIFLSINLTNEKWSAAKHGVH